VFFKVLKLCSVVTCELGLKLLRILGGVLEPSLSAQLGRALCAVSELCQELGARLRWSVKKPQGSRYTQCLKQGRRDASNLFWCGFCFSSWSWCSVKDVGKDAANQLTCSRSVPRWDLAFQGSASQ